MGRWPGEFCPLFVSDAWAFIVVARALGVVEGNRLRGKLETREANYP